LIWAFKSSFGVSILSCLATFSENWAKFYSICLVTLVLTQSHWEVCLLIAIEIGLHHSPDGIANPKYKLLCFITTNFFAKRRTH